MIIWRSTIVELIVTELGSTMVLVTTRFVVKVTVMCPFNVVLPWTMLILVYIDVLMGLLRTIDVSSSIRSAGIILFPAGRLGCLSSRVIV